MTVPILVVAVLVLVVVGVLSQRSANKACKEGNYGDFVLHAANLLFAQAVIIYATYKICVLLGGGK